MIALSTFAACKGKTPGDSATRGEGTAQTQNMGKLSDLMGKEIQSRNGEDLGKISDVLYDQKSYTITYSIVDSKGRLYPIPITALSLEPRSGRATLNVDRNRFVLAPNFPKDRWPDLNNGQVISDIHSYYGVAPAMGDRSGMAKSSDRQNENPAAGAESGR